MYNVAHAQIELAHFETAYDLFLLILINTILIIIHSWGNISKNNGVGDPKGPSLHKTTKKKKLSESTLSELQKTVKVYNNQANTLWTKGATC